MEPLHIDPNGEAVTDVALREVGAETPEDPRGPQASPEPNEPEAAQPLPSPSPAGREARRNPPAPRGAGRARPAAKSSSARRVASSRANGAKSRGPVTPEGKARSARNAITHGLLSDAVVLETEKSSLFIETVEGLEASLKPTNVAAEILVQHMALARWRQLRTAAILRQAFDSEIAKLPATIPNEARAFAVFRNFADNSRTLDLLDRYENRAFLQFTRSLRLFRQINQPDPDSCQTNPVPTPHTPPEWPDDVAPAATPAPDGLVPQSNPGGASPAASVSVTPAASACVAVSSAVQPSDPEPGDARPNSPSPHDAGPGLSWFLPPREKSQTCIQPQRWPRHARNRSLQTPLTCTTITKPRVSTQTVTSN